MAIRGRAGEPSQNTALRGSPIVSIYLMILSCVSSTNGTQTVILCCLAHTIPARNSRGLPTTIHERQVKMPSSRSHPSTRKGMKVNQTITHIEGWEQKSVEISISIYSDCSLYYRRILFP